MPAAYAHNRFGSDCIDTLPDRLKMLTLAYREIFDFGVHGPDILFYNDPLHKNPVNSWGSEMHTHTAREFFTRAKAAYEEYPEKKDMTAYLLGFLAHFTLDTCCHGYINERSEALPLSHNFIESQYEAFLMCRDGKNPLKVDRSESLHPSKKTAHVIAHFFDLTDSDVLKSLKGQRTVMKLFYSPAEIKKKTIRRLIRLLKIGGSFDDLFIDTNVHPLCEETIPAIAAMQAEALERYPKLAENLLRFLRGKEDLCPFFDRDFEGIDHNQH